MSMSTETPRDRKFLPIWSAKLPITTRPSMMSKIGAWSLSMCVKLGIMRSSKCYAIIRRRKRTSNLDDESISPQILAIPFNQYEARKKIMNINVFRLSGIGYVANGHLFRNLSDVEDYVSDYCKGSSLFVQDADESVAAYWKQKQCNGKANYWGSIREHRHVINSYL